MRDHSTPPIYKPPKRDCVWVGLGWTHRTGGRYGFAHTWEDDTQRQVIFLGGLSFWRQALEIGFLCCYSAVWRPFGGGVQPPLATEIAGWLQLSALQIAPIRKSVQILLKMPRWSQRLCIAKKAPFLNSFSWTSLNFLFFELIIKEK